MRPRPDDRSAWSHGPIARVQSRHQAPAEATLPPEAAAWGLPSARNLPQPGYRARPGYQAQPGYEAQSGYPARTGYEAQAGYPARTGYEARTDYQAQPGYQARTAAPPHPRFPPARGGFGLPSLRRNVCPHFYMTGSRGAIPIQAPHLLKGLLRQPNNVSRCQLRGGVHLDDGFVNDVCLTPRFNQCVFYEDELTRE